MITSEFLSSYNFKCTYHWEIFLWDIHVLPKWRILQTWEMAEIDVSDVNHLRPKLINLNPFLPIRHCNFNPKMFESANNVPIHIASCDFMDVDRRSICELSLTSDWFQSKVEDRWIAYNDIHERKGVLFLSWPRQVVILECKFIYLVS
jgi:hypothetical protein